MGVKIENPVETAIGAGVLAVAAFFALYASQAGDGPSLAGDTYPLTATFRTADGIAPGSDVRIAGVKVGSVTAMTLDPRTFRARVIVEVRSDLELDDDTLAKIDSDGLLGGAYVALVPGAGEHTLEAGDQIERTQPSVSFLSLLAKFVNQSGSDE